VVIFLNRIEVEVTVGIVELGKGIVNVIHGDVQAGNGFELVICAKVED
jgi:hypothetical protein